MNSTNQLIQLEYRQQDSQNNKGNNNAHKQYHHRFKEGDGIINPSVEFIFV
jgi:hypothetical protein